MYSKSSQNGPKVKNTLSIITATYNEVENIEHWFDLVINQLSKIESLLIESIIVVDDGSTDGTKEKIKSLKKINSKIEIKLIERYRKSGTLDAQITGAKHSSSKYLLLLDADLQHDPKYIPIFVKYIMSNYDLVIGSRYLEKQKQEWGLFRFLVSQTAVALSKWFIKQARPYSDPVSGYFAIRRDLLADLSPFQGGYKPMLYSLASHNDITVKEIPIKMNKRIAGESKIVNMNFIFLAKFLREIILIYLKSRRIRRYK